MVHVSILVEFLLCVERPVELALRGLHSRPQDDTSSDVSGRRAAKFIYNPSTNVS